MHFKDLVLEHLSQYRVESLGLLEDGIFNYRGRKIPKSHILPISDRDKNIIEAYRDKFFKSEYSHIDLHRYFHHLNSSQALCVNLFYPLIAEDELSLFLEFLGIRSKVGLDSLFEKESDLETTRGRRTSFDFYVQLENNGSIFVEVKYTEDVFGKAKNDAEHQRKFRETYLPLLTDKSQYLAPICMDESVFFKHYQILRNLVHISDVDYVVLLFPSSNVAVAEGALYARDHLLTPAGRERLRIVYLDEFVKFLEDKSADNQLDGYYQCFRTKYLMSAAFVGKRGQKGVRSKRGQV